MKDIGGTVSVAQENIEEIKEVIRASILKLEEVNHWKYHPLTALAARDLRRCLSIGEEG